MSPKEIKKRIRSVENIAQITKAMEVVSMTKMRRSQEFALAARPFALAGLDLLKHLVAMTPAEHLPKLLKTAERHNSILLVVVTADKGLVGGFNDQVLRKAEQFISGLKLPETKIGLITVGRKAEEYFKRRGRTPLKSFTNFGDYTEFSDTKPVAETIIKEFLDNNFEVVQVIYTHFKTTLKQEVKLRKILPAQKESLEEIIHEIIPESGRYSELHKEKSGNQKYSYYYSFEPSPEAIISDLVSTILKIAFHHIMLESNASEHSARMITMKNARDNATDLRERLVIQMNKVRQNTITTEISEIIAGAQTLHE